jgi:hypothetical protein
MLNVGLKVTTHLKGGENRSEGCEWQLDQIRNFILRDLVESFTEEEIAEEWQQLSSRYVEIYKYQENKCINQGEPASTCHYLYSCPDDLNLYKKTTTNNENLLLEDVQSGLEDANLSFTQTGPQRRRF